MNKLALKSTQSVASHMIRRLSVANSTMAPNMEEIRGQLEKAKSVMPEDKSPDKKDLEAIKMAARKLLRKRDAHTEIRKRPPLPNVKRPSQIK